MSSPPASDSGPESIFAAWVARLESGEDLDLADLAREHPLHAESLLELAAMHTRLQRILEEYGGEASLSGRLRSRFGPDVDPKVSLTSEQGSGEPFSSQVLGRLASRSSASGRYRLKGEVARGGMGVVLRVWDEDLRRHLAMKVVLDSSAAGTDASGHEKLIGRFLEEAQVTSQLEHPGIVPVHELGLDASGRVYFTMKLVQGLTFSRVIAGVHAGDASWTRIKALGVLQRVCEAMAYAHDKGVIHRDLKPSNLMVGRYGEAYVMDWGLAKVLGERRDEPESDRRPKSENPLTSLVLSERQDHAGATPDSPLVTMDGDVVGTPSYMSPEQAAGRLSELGPTTDVYAVGALLYHLLSGSMPYVPAGTTCNNHAVWQRVLEGPPRPLLEVAPDVPVELASICERAMQREATERYPDMGAFAADLAAYLEGRVVQAHEAGAWAEARKWVQRNRPLAASLAAALVLAIGGLAGIGYVQAKGRAAERVQRQRADLKADEARSNMELAEQNELAARENLALAQRNEALAEEQRDLARAETAKVLRLSDVKLLQQLEDQVEELWPAHPDRIGDLQAWLDRARALHGDLERHRDTLEEMRTRALEWSNAERAADRATHPSRGLLASLRSELEELIDSMESGLSGKALDEADARLVELEPQVEQLAAEVTRRRTWSFASAEDQWQHDVLAELVRGLEGLDAQLLSSGTTTEAHGWSVSDRLAFARTLAMGYAPGGEYARAWDEALPELSDSNPEVLLTPLVGLVPIGVDPQSGLWEFAHLATGTPPERSADGSLVLSEETSLVLVLLPSGTFWMGAQSNDPNGPNYDPLAVGNEAPPHRVKLSACLISKYELNQAQYERLAGVNPSSYQNIPFAPTKMQPVEQVSWDDCRRWLRRAGLDFPSEAQWEYAARAGTDTPWWTGEERDSLAELRAANLADRTAARNGAPWATLSDWPELDDGYLVHAPVGSFAANGFGLHEMTGNLWEWCLDSYLGGYGSEPLREDPVVRLEAFVPRVFRGGGYDGTARDARSANRQSAPASGANLVVGLRPALALRP